MDGDQSWDLDFEQVFEYEVDEQFLAKCTKGVVAFEVYEETSTGNPGRVQSKVPTGNFDFSLHVDVCELDYEGEWSPVPTKYEVLEAETYNKIYRYLFTFCLFCLFCMFFLIKLEFTQLD